MTEAMWSERETGSGREGALGEAESPGGARERDSADARWERARAMMVRQFNIEAAFVDVPKLARIVGLAPSTLYGYIRAGVFFIPYRLVNERPLISLDDLVDWYCSGSPVDPVPGPPLAPKRPIGVRCVAPPPEPPKTTAQIVAEAEAKLGIAARTQRRRSAP